MKWVVFCLSLMLVLLAALTFSGTLGVSKGPSDILLGPLEGQLKGVGPFSKEAKDNFGEGFLGSQLDYLQSDIEKSLKFLGSNTRPDAQLPTFNFVCHNCPVTLKGTSHPLEALGGFDFQQHKNFRIKLQVLESNKLELTLYNQDCISEQFTTVLKDCSESVEVQIGSHKLDSYFLTRQKVQYVGSDLFLQAYGGDEYSMANVAIRLDFLHASRNYFHFVKEKDYLVWDTTRWCLPEADSHLYPLMEILKIDEGYIIVSVFDTSGKKRVNIRLNKQRVTPIPKKPPPLHFIGAKSPCKWLFKEDKSRLLVTPGDWLLSQGHRWVKIDSIEAIDSYISRHTIGELFIVKELLEVDGKKQVVGELFNTSRTQKVDHSVEVTLSSAKH